jgi:hypothetical protein
MGLDFANKELAIRSNSVLPKIRVSNYNSRAVVFPTSLSVGSHRGKYFRGRMEVLKNPQKISKRTPKLSESKR